MPRINSGDYPTGHQLRKVKTWNCIKDPAGLVEYIGDIWWVPDWGYKLSGKRVLKLYLSTGGWSGNESIIRAMEDNRLFWSLFWESSRRGGHYTFRIELREWHKKHTKTDRKKG